MPPPSRKRRAVSIASPQTSPTLTNNLQPAAEQDEDAEEATPQPTQRTQQRRRRSTSSVPADSDHESNSNSTGQQQLVKNLVRLALASEYSRTPIRRQDISTKVLGENSRQFKPVFEEAQNALRRTFGMEMLELPARERHTLTQKRAAQRSQTQGAGAAASSKSWVLVSVLPAAYRQVVAQEGGPSKAPTADVEGSYVGLYTFIVALVMLSGGQLSEAKLERHLRRCNAEQTTPVDQTEKVLSRMVKEGYLGKTKDSSSGEELIEYHVGPRGRVEVGEYGVSGLVKKVYGLQDESEEVNQEINRRLEKSLRVAAASTSAAQSTAQPTSTQTLSATQKPSRSRRRQRNDSDEDD